jgi:quercetin 2,3-dioxygenase
MKVKNISKVEGTLPVRDPYILSAYHYDLYPKGNGKMGIDPEHLTGKNIGQDFDRNAEWRMYHGETIPGFPHHPHRGFEIVTIVEEGFADHFDSKGSKGRYGNGDVQLMSAGSGVLHGEMFPLLNDDEKNPFRLFQIWLNMHSSDKLSDPTYKMLWSEKIPESNTTDQNGGNVKVRVILGEYNGVKSQDPLAHSWARNPKHNVGIALVELDPDTTFTLPAVSETLNRFVFFYDGTDTISIDNYKLQERFIADAAGNEEIVIKNGQANAKILILEGEPINEPVAAYGPFVMNSDQEIQEAFREYQRTQFGGWPWGDKETDIVNPKEAGRFASYNLGQEIDKPE